MLTLHFSDAHIIQCRLVVVVVYSRVAAAAEEIIVIVIISQGFHLHRFTMIVYTQHFAHCLISLLNR